MTRAVAIAVAIAITIAVAVFPSSLPAPFSAVVLLPDVFGFDTPETTGAAKLLAQQGYNTLVPDIYR